MQQDNIIKKLENELCRFTICRIMSLIPIATKLSRSSSYDQSYHFKGCCLQNRYNYHANSNFLTTNQLICYLIGVLFFGLVFSSNSCSAASASLTITADGVIQNSPISENITASPGTTTYSKEFTVNVTATQIESYVLKLSGSSSLTSSDGSTIIGGAGGKTGTTMDDNTWGYGWGDISTAKENLSYQTLLPSGSNLSMDNVSNNSINTNRKLVFAAKFSKNNAQAGHYISTVSLSLVTTPMSVTRTLTYDVNGGNSSNQTQACQDYGDGCNITISYIDPTRTNFVFQGWSDSSNGTVNSNYSKNEVVALTNNKTVFAVWQEDEPWKNITTMQQMTPAACNQASIGTSKQLTDSRDNNTYTIRKHEDGRCWMVENLKLTGNRTLTSTDTDITNNFSLPASLTSLSSSDFSSSTSYNTTAQSYYASNLINTTGIFYNWYAATGGTGDASVVTGEVSGSICPKGWKLPTGLSNSELITLSDAVKNITSRLRGADYGFDATGYIRDGTRSETGTGYWWASTATNNWHNANWANYLSVGSNGIAYNGYVQAGVMVTDYGVMRYNGYAVRCLARS